MIVIWGSRTRIIELGTGYFFCPRCNTKRWYVHKRAARYFTLYFIPLFQTRNLGEYIECGHCNQTYKPEVLNYKPPASAASITERA